MGADDIPAKPETVAGSKVEDGILEAARDGDLEKLEKCFKPGLGEHVSLKGAWQSTPLHIAAENGHVSIVKQLIEWNCDVNAKNVLQYTPLHYAVTCGHTPVVEVLAKVANLNELNKNHCTPLLLAVENNQEDMVKILLDSKADPNIPDKSDNTPLHVAVINHCVGLADQLIGAHCQNNAQNKEGERPLHIAVNEEDCYMLLMLLGHGCDPTLCNKANKRPVDVAREKPGEVAVEIVKHLEKEMIEQGVLKEMTSEDFFLIEKEAGFKKHYKMVFRKLGIEEGDIVEQEQKNTSIQEKAYQLFLSWKNKCSSDATVAKFCTVLLENDLKSLSDQLQDQFKK